MDLWCLHVKTNLSCPFLLLRNTPDKSAQSMKNSLIFQSRSFRIDEDLRVFGIGGSLKKLYGSKECCNNLFIARAMGGKKNSNNFDSSSSGGDSDQSTPEGDDLEGSNPSPEKYQSHDAPSQKSNVKPLDWREFRALLYMNEQVKVSVSESQKQEKSSFGSKALPAKWAHPLSATENGCLLVATEKLDGVRTFERTVVLLLKSGTRTPWEGPFGIIINRPLHKKIKHIKPTNLHLATTFADCYLYSGGPIEAILFLSRAGENSDLTGFEGAIPGLCFGVRNDISAAGRLTKKGILNPQDFRFFYGYAGWHLDQLNEEIDSGYWHVAACSANLLSTRSQNSSSEGLWEEVLQLMGGHYSELSRKPKQDI